MSERGIGPLSDPAVRRERARRARAAQTTIGYHIARLVESANTLSLEPWTGSVVDLAERS